MSAVIYWPETDWHECADEAPDGSIVTNRRCMAQHLPVDPLTWIAEFPLGDYHWAWCDYHLEVLMELLNDEPWGRQWKEARMLGH